MEKKKVLFVSQEIMPYLKESAMSKIGRYLPQGIQEKGREIRAFMPRYGLVNERRNQLHEVIRLSGMNLIIDDTDHPLIIKVASIQTARMQVYFIDNEDYFQRKFILKDADDKLMEDNDERSIFFARGVLETVKKLRWAPDVVHCHGWITSLLPLYLKQCFKDDPLFATTKIVYSIYEDVENDSLPSNFKKKLKIDGVTNKDVAVLDESNYFNTTKLGINMSDGVIFGSANVDDSLKEYAYQSGKPVLEYQPPEKYIDEYSVFYDKIMAE